MPVEKHGDFFTGVVIHHHLQIIEQFPVAMDMTAPAMGTPVAAQIISAKPVAILRKKPGHMPISAGMFTQTMGEKDISLGALLHHRRSQKKRRTLSIGEKCSRKKRTGGMVDWEKALIWEKSPPSMRNKRYLQCPLKLICF